MSRTPFELETTRLRLREFTEHDAEALYLLNSDPEVMRYTGDSPFSDIPSAQRFLANYPYYDRDGFGRWAVLGKEGDEFMGWCGLRRNGSEDPVDLGFRLYRRFWASGYATEAAAACLRVGFEALGLGEIVARVLRENGPSISVLQKLGMKYRDMVEQDGEFWLVYAVSADPFMETFLPRLTRSSV